MPECGVCKRPAEVIATVPMCGERPRYPMCWECFEPINWSGYAEEVTPLVFDGEADA
jgi:hypothetical protein